jgi:hypothetical protein
VASIQPLDIRFELRNIHAFDNGESGGAEPYLWTVFFKLDGDTVSVQLSSGGTVALTGSAVVVGTPGNQGDLLNDDVEDHKDAGIPASIGQFQTTLNPILVNGIQDFAVTRGYVGCVAILLEEDNTHNSFIATGHAALNASMQKVLDGLIAKLNDKLSSKPLSELADSDKNKAEIAALLKTEVDSMAKQLESDVLNAIGSDFTVWDWVAGLGDMDNLIGTYVGYFSYDELANASVLPISQRWKKEGDWELTGQIVVSGWKGWFGLGGQIKDAPAVVTPSPGRIDIYVRGLDDRLWQKWWTGSEWMPSADGWSQHDDGDFRLTSAPAVLHEGPGFRDVYVRGQDGAVYHKFWRG